MKKTTILFAMLVAIACSSCRTPREWADYHIKKALKYDPSVISRQTTDTLIKGIAEDTITVRTPEKQGNFDFDCDSLKKLLDAQVRKNGNTLPAGSVLVHDDSVLNVEVKKGQNGKFSLNYTVKPQIIYVPVKVPYEVRVTVPGKKVEVFKKYPLYTYLWFWILCAFALLASYMWLKDSKPVTYVLNRFSDKSKSGESL